MKTSRNPSDSFERLAALARTEVVPRPDVTGRVRARLAAAGTMAGALRESLLPGWLYGLTSAVSLTALACAWVGWQTWSMLSDPLSGWLLTAAMR